MARRPRNSRPSTRDSASERPLIRSCVGAKRGQGYVDSPRDESVLHTDRRPPISLPDHRRLKVQAFGRSRDSELVASRYVPGRPRRSVPTQMASALKNDSASDQATRLTMRVSPSLTGPRTMRPLPATLRVEAPPHAISSTQVSPREISCRSHAQAAVRSQRRVALRDNHMACERAAARQAQCPTRWEEAATSRHPDARPPRPSPQRARPAECRADGNAGGHRKPTAHDAGACGPIDDIDRCSGARCAKQPHCYGHAL